MQIKILFYNGYFLKNDYKRKIEDIFKSGNDINILILKNNTY